MPCRPIEVRCAPHDMPQRNHKSTMDMIEGQGQMFALIIADKVPSPLEGEGEDGGAQAEAN